jgi:hypothetical protein
MHAPRRLSDTELVNAKKRRRAGEVSLACEGLYLTAEEKALFDRFERERLPHDECRRQIAEYIRARYCS